MGHVTVFTVLVCSWTGLLNHRWFKGANFVTSAATRYFDSPASSTTLDGKIKILFPLLFSMIEWNKLIKAHGPPHVPHIMFA